MRVATFDIETDNLLPDVTKVHCAVVKDHEDGISKRFDPSNIGDLCRYLSLFDVLIGHNSIQFDFPVLRKIFGWDFKGTKVDTLLMSRLQRPQRIAPKGSTSGPHSVESWGIRLGHGKVENEEWGEYTSHMLHRCEQDCEIQYKIYHELLREGAGEGWRHAHVLNHKLHHYLQLQEERGWQVDVALLDESIEWLEKWMDKIKVILEPRLPYVLEIKETKKEGEYGWVKKPFTKSGELRAIYCDWLADSNYTDNIIVGPFSRISFRRTDLDKNKEVKEYLLSLGWDPAEWNYKDGKRTSPKLSITNHEETFEGLEGGIGKLIARRFQCKQRLGVLEGWRVALDSRGRIHPGVSGIASTARLKHRLVANIPSIEKETFFAKRMRAVFTASPGMVMVGVDSAGNQMRQLAARMREAGYPDADFEEALLNGDRSRGTDLHSVNMRKAKLPTRGHAKNFFYGFIFGAGDTKTGKLVQGTAADGKKIKDDYLSAMPGIKHTINFLTGQWRASAQKYYDPKFGRLAYRNGYIKGIDGRPILVESEHAVLCYALQSDEAIQMSVAYVMLHKWAEDRGWKLGEDWAACIFYHDEFQLECKPELADELLSLACKAIKWAGEFLKIKFPHEGAGSIGRNWAETH